MGAQRKDFGLVNNRQSATYPLRSIGRGARIFWVCI
jgi:hypothetical protein